MIQLHSKIRLVAGTLTVMLFVGFSWPALAQKPRPVESLIANADAIVVVEILSTDYTRTPADGPMVAVAKVLKVLKGPFIRGRRIRFAETAWVGPSYEKREYRVLFLEKTDSPEAAKASAWWILSHLSARRDYFIERDSIPDLSLESLRTLVEKI
ncbi:MAG: hypothetical protein M3O61_06845 [Gemmatimonadota bacterium]|nr:hypothetical protein [Gemmatimonadota bacterium]